MRKAIAVAWCVAALLLGACAPVHAGVQLGAAVNLAATENGEEPQAPTTVDVTVSWDEPAIQFEWNGNAWERKGGSDYATLTLTNKAETTVNATLSCGTPTYTGNGTAAMLSVKGLLAEKNGTAAGTTLTLPLAPSVPNHAYLHYNIATPTAPADFTMTTTVNITFDTTQSEGGTQQ